MYVFPFPVPDELTAAALQALSADDFATLDTNVRAHAAELLADAGAKPDALIATQSLFNLVQTEQTRRTEEAASAAAAREGLTAGLTPPAAPPAPAPEVASPADTTTPPATPPAPEATPPAPPANPGSTLDTPPEPEPERFATLVASVDTANAGTEMTFAEVNTAVERRLTTYGGDPHKTNPRAKRVPGSKNRFVIGGRTLQRHHVAEIQRQYPDNLRITDTNNALAVLDYATSESRLPGGSLVASMEIQLKRGKALTAAAGWCAPSEIIYDLCALESLDGILDLSEVQASRGGFMIPENGGPSFASIYDSIGDDGDVILTEYEVENGAEKVCIEIPCPPFVETRLDVAYICLTGSLLQRRGYPEVVTRFTQGAMVALAHKINESVIARMVAGSGSPVVVPGTPGSDDAASQLLSAVELAIEDMKYRHRMPRNTTIEVVLPAWTIAPIRAALARRRGVLAINVSDAEILAAFTTRRAVPRFVYDWQDAFAGLVGGPGGTTPITAFPDEVQMLVYPAGTWTKIVQDVVNLDTVYDNALLTQNQFTAVFAEDGFNVLKMCPESRLYQTALDPAGIVGCCDADTVS